MNVSHRVLRYLVAVQNLQTVTLKGDVGVPAKLGPKFARARVVKNAAPDSELRKIMVLNQLFSKTPTFRETLGDY